MIWTICFPVIVIVVFVAFADITSAALVVVLLCYCVVLLL